MIDEKAVNEYLKGKTITNTINKILKDKIIYSVEKISTYSLNQRLEKMVDAALEPIVKKEVTKFLSDENNKNKVMNKLISKRLLK